MNINEFVTLLNTLSLGAAQCLDDSELALLSAAFSQIGVTFAMVSVLRSTCQNDGSATNDDVITTVI